MRHLKILLFIFALVAASMAGAKVIQVPEQCYLKQKSPCLTKIVDGDTVFRFGKTRMRVQKDSVIQWKTFDDISMDLLKGRIQVYENKGIFRVNEVFVKAKANLIERQENALLILELEHFKLSTFTIQGIATMPEHSKKIFLEKTELLQFAAGFFKRKKAYLAFLKSVEKPWKREFLAQTKDQTKVLERSIASAAEAQKAELEEQRILSEELKRVRELFFYRTFFR